MEKKEKILGYIDSQPWGKDFLDFLKEQGKTLDDYELDRYLICNMDWEHSNRSKDEWLLASVAFSDWYNLQNFE